MHFLKLIRKQFCCWALNYYPQNSVKKMHFFDVSRSPATTVRFKGNFQKVQTKKSLGKELTFDKKRDAFLFACQLSGCFINQEQWTVLSSACMWIIHQRLLCSLLSALAAHKKEFLGQPNTFWNCHLMNSKGISLEFLAQLHSVSSDESFFRDLAIKASLRVSIMSTCWL